MPSPDKQPKSRFWIPESGTKAVILFVFFSWLLHTLSLVSLPSYEEISRKQQSQRKEKKTPVKITFKESPKKDAKEPKKQEIHEQKKMVEVIQKETKEQPDPDLARHGYTTHRAEKETRVIKKDFSKGKDPSRAEDLAKKSSRQANKKPGKPAETPPGAFQQKNRKIAAKPSPGAESRQKPEVAPKPMTLLDDPDSSVAFKLPEPQKPRNNYEKLLGKSLAMMGGEMEAGYQDYIEDEVEVGETLDLNTQEYRYIGYFTNLRKAIELAWVYPSKAVKRRLYGNVFLKFTISSEGKVSKILVLDSSGHRVLDTAVVEAIKLAAPFAPLPHSFGKQINIQGTFRYVLN